MKFANQSRFRAIAICASSLLIMATASQSHAAESASGAYLLGLRGADAGIAPPEGLYLSSQTYLCTASISGNVPFQGGQIAGQPRVTPIVNVSALLCATPVEIAGGRLGFSATVPFGRVEVSGLVGPLQQADSTFTVADLRPGGERCSTIDASCIFLNRR